MKQRHLYRNNIHNNATKVLYVVTSLAEYNNGKRKTIKGQDRFLHQLVPILIDSVESMVSSGLEVDVYLITAYKLRIERENLIRRSLPFHVGLQIWDDALPINYEGHPTNTTGRSLKPNTRSLARQHRYVVRDKIEHYDMFVAFEDDMLIHGTHVEHYYKLSLEIEKLRIHAPVTIETPMDDVDEYARTKFFGTMSKPQLERVVPGFVRVEVIVNETDRTAQTNVIPKYPIDHTFDELNGEEKHIDPTICCHFHNEYNIPSRNDNNSSNNNDSVVEDESTVIDYPKSPLPDDLIVWETNIKAFQIRQFPSLPSSSSEASMIDWAILMMGPGKMLPVGDKIGGYWSGRNGAFGDDKKPSGGEPKLVAQQGGWMATKEQLIRMNNKLCLAKFLPPFDNVGKGNDGLDPHNVEFWSGSYQFFTGAFNHCNMQRIIVAHPDHFSKHLLYHTANNKQKQLASYRMVRANHLFGQVNFLKKNAERTKQRVLKEKNK
jgi:hypothetical protein